MASFSIRKRSGKKSKVSNASFNRKNSPLEKTNQTVTKTGASVAIRPKLNAIRQMDSKGVGTVRYF